MKCDLLTAAAVLVLTGSAAVGQATPVQPTPGATTELTVPTYRAKQVLGTRVMIQGDTAVGTVDDLVFDEAGNLDYLVVNNGGKLVTVPWEAAKFNFEKKTATLAVTPDEFKVIPTYTTTTYPSFYTPAYRTEVYKYYNLTPRELRRLRR